MCEPYTRALTVLPRGITLNDVWRRLTYDQRRIFKHPCFDRDKQKNVAAFMAGIALCIAADAMRIVKSPFEGDEQDVLAIIGTDGEPCYWAVLNMGGELTVYGHKRN